MQNLPADTNKCALRGGSDRQEHEKQIIGDSLHQALAWRVLCLAELTVLYLPLVALKSDCNRRTRVMSWADNSVVRPEGPVQSQHRVLKSCPVLEDCVRDRDRERGGGHRIKLVMDALLMSFLDLLFLKKRLSA